MWEFNERRIAPRHKTRLRCRLLFPAAESAAGLRRPSAPPLVGYTRDISASGLAVIVANIKGYGHLMDLDYTLLVELDLPAGQLEIQTNPRRVERLVRDATDSGYLLGLQIKKINESLLPRFEQYLYALG